MFLAINLPFMKPAWRQTGGRTGGVLFSFLTHLRSLFLKREERPLEDIFKFASERSFCKL
ncbi:MAG: hypothetical protein A2057_11795 [Ignavibacteria bacterium GWA2_35_9]|nr:MAG: hypothetical protein A2057_11795 [Ignavibacteria bacterium GWA2_35_9]OGU47677.1 MAG: hypothetical protein A2000_12160 [Ignavibacteria bacterium GWB2_36_8]OGU48045.1 MAG: hypothetical protein A2080_07580 [Ignavibacteria bacterium GWC2_36_12]